MTPADDESFRQAQEDLERRDPPPDEEETASFKGMGHAISIIRERHGLSREEAASRSACASLPKLSAYPSPL
jgi:hypothetical protein